MDCAWEIVHSGSVRQGMAFAVQAPHSRCLLRHFNTGKILYVNSAKVLFLDDPATELEGAPLVVEFDSVQLVGVKTLNAKHNYRIRVAGQKHHFLSHKVGTLSLSSLEHNAKLEKYQKIMDFLPLEDSLYSESRYVQYA